MSVPHEPPDLTIAWTPDGVFARATPESETALSTVFWFLVTFWSALAAMPLGMAVGIPIVTLAVLLLGAFGAWMTLLRAPQAVEIHGHQLTFRGFDRLRVPLDHVTEVLVSGSRLTVQLSDGRAPWLWVPSWSPLARQWIAQTIEDAAARARRARKGDAELEEAARRSLEPLRAEPARPRRPQLTSR